MENRMENRREYTLDHLVTSYDPHGSYGGSILIPATHRGDIIIIWGVSRSRQHSKAIYPWDDKRRGKTGKHGKVGTITTKTVGICKNERKAT